MPKLQGELKTPVSHESLHDGTADALAQALAAAEQLQPSPTSTSTKPSSSAHHPADLTYKTVVTDTASPPVRKTLGPKKSVAGPSAGAKKAAAEKKRRRMVSGPSSESVLARQRG